MYTKIRKIRHKSLFFPVCFFIPVSEIDLNFLQPLIHNLLNFSHPVAFGITFHLPKTSPPSPLLEGRRGVTTPSKFTY
jgi:hypothetical protein